MSLEKILKSIKKAEEEVSFIESKGRSMAREIIVMAEEGARRIESIIERVVKEKGEEVLSSKMKETEKRIEDIRKAHEMERMALEEKVKVNLDKSVEEIVKIILKEFKEG